MEKPSWYTLPPSGLFPPLVIGGLKITFGYFQQGLPQFLKSPALLHKYTWVGNVMVIEDFEEVVDILEKWREILRKTDELEGFEGAMPKDDGEIIFREKGKDLFLSEDKLELRERSEEDRRRMEERTEEMIGMVDGDGSK
ncbi:hypothetical protein AKJ66_02670 [candidate division MSBL1 archaeon SCGC-AAA259E22]|uniref:Uncharacterized protein n=1 Tax=candidate division MSBL1 archaeon SCGC-AAA259E22 TaxID=1698265 RepID=A0A133UG26_9EURY|nr:hypothetical protein AKJ66_02670 [candidate division MSBL1 archaeon SCGC-AAA259E22]